MILIFYYYLYLQKNYMEITESTKTLSFDDAVELYNNGNDEDKAIALFFFDEEDLRNSFVDNFPIALENPKMTAWENFCANYKTKHNEGECYISTESEIRKPTIGDTVNDKSDKNLVPNIECANAILALTQLLQLREFYRQGWKPSPDDKDDYYAVSICVTYKNTNPTYNLEVITRSYNFSNDFPEFYDVFTFKYYDIANAFKKNHEDLLMEYAKIYL